MAEDHPEIGESKLDQNTGLFSNDRMPKITVRRSIGTWMDESAYLALERIAISRRVTVNELASRILTEAAGRG